jgi:HK97 family phage portal protein
MQYAKMLSGQTPIFSQYGQSVYASDIVQNCIDVIATECSKLQPRHIKVDNKTGVQSTPNSNINRLFDSTPNQIMITSDFIEKVVWMYCLNYNSFIYPTYEKKVDTNGNESKSFTGFYPLNPSRVEFLQDISNQLFVKFYFSGGNDVTIPYSDVIHLRKKFSLNEVMGGGANGSPDNTALQQVINADSIALQGMEKAIKTSLSVQAIMKVNTLLNGEKAEAERKRFEKQIESGESGFLVTDLATGDVTPFKMDPKVIDKETMEFIESRILKWWGVSSAVASGNFTDEEYQATYERALEPILIKMGQAFTKCCFTQRERDVGNKIVFYQRDMMYLSTAAKLDLIKTGGEQGLLSDDQKLAILGYPPLADGSGSRITQSLNFMDRSYITTYQLSGKSTTTKEEK